MKAGQAKMTPMLTVVVHTEDEMEILMLPSLAQSRLELTLILLCNKTSLRETFYVVFGFQICEYRIVGTLIVHCLSELQSPL